MQICTLRDRSFFLSFFLTFFSRERYIDLVLSIQLRNVVRSCYFSFSCISSTDFLFSLFPSSLSVSDSLLYSRFHQETFSPILKYSHDLPFFLSLTPLHLNVGGLSSPFSRSFPSPFPFTYLLFLASYLAYSYPFPF